MTEGAGVAEGRMRAACWGEGREGAENKNKPPNVATQESRIIKILGFRSLNPSVISKYNLG